MDPDLLYANSGQNGYPEESGEENRLLDSFRNGNTGALEYLIDKYDRPLYFYIVSIISDSNFARDISQECFIRLWERRGSFNTLLSIRVFLYRAGHNLAIDHLDRKKVRRKHQAAVSVEMKEDFLNEKMVEEELIARLYDSIGRLPGECARVFMMSMEGTSNKNIAENLGISVNTVKTQKQRAKKMLREWLGGAELMFIISASGIIR